MYITVKMLERDGMSQAWIDRFRTLFGERVAVTSQNIEKALNGELGLSYIFLHTPQRFKRIMDDFVYKWGDHEGRVLFFDDDVAAGMALLTIVAELDDQEGE